MRWNGVFRKSPYPGFYGSSSEKPASQHQLHIPVAIGDQVNDDLASHNTVDHPVGLERGLVVILDTQCHQLLRVAASLGELRQAFHDLHLKPIVHL